MSGPRLYAVYDRVAEAVDGPLFQFRNDAAAVRMLFDLLANRQTGPGMHPEDYQLLCVAELDDGGRVIGLPAPVVCATGTQWLETRRREEAAQAQLKLEA